MDGGIRVALDDACGCLLLRLGLDRYRLWWFVLVRLEDDALEAFGVGEIELMAGGSFSGPLHTLPPES